MIFRLQFTKKSIKSNQIHIQIRKRTSQSEYLQKNYAKFLISKCKSAQKQRAKQAIEKNNSEARLLCLNISRCRLTFLFSRKFEWVRFITTARMNSFILLINSNGAIQSQRFICISNCLDFLSWSFFFA